MRLLYLITSASAVIVTNLALAFSAVAQPKISDADLFIVQDQCIKNAEASGHTYVSTISTETEEVTKNGKLASRVTLVLALTKDGVSYQLTCPLTIEKETIFLSSEADSSKSSAANRSASGAATSRTTKGWFRSYWWVFLPLLLPLLWFLFRKSSGSEPTLVTTPKDNPETNLQIAPIHALEDRAEIASLPDALITDSKDPSQLLGDNFMEDKEPHSAAITNQFESSRDEDVLQVVEEDMTVGKKLLERSRVRVNKRVETYEEIVDVPIVHERFRVEHIPINQVIEGDVPIERDEGEIHIIPIIEEIVTTEARLWFREEVYISKQRRYDTLSSEVTLRRELAEFERVSYDESQLATKLLDETNAQEIAPPVPPNPKLQLTAPEPTTDRNYAYRSAETTTAANRDRVETESQLPPRGFTQQTVSPTKVNAQSDGTTTEEVVIPVVAEEITLETQRIPHSKVRIHKKVEARQQSVSTPAMYEQLVIEHVPINQYVEGASPREREENGVWIIPILEEVMVSTTQLLLKEEIHIMKQRITEANSQTVTLRREVVDLEQIDLTEDHPDR